MLQKDTINLKYQIKNLRNSTNLTVRTVDVSHPVRIMLVTRVQKQRVVGIWKNPSE